MSDATKAQSDSAYPRCGDYGGNVTECAACQFDYGQMEGQDFATSAGPLAAAYVDLLESTSGTILRARPSLDVWSPLEYACHVRDLLLVQRERVLAARRQGRPVAEPMGRDERVEHDGYNHQSPSDVARQLSDATLLLSNAFGRLSPADWDRTVIYPYAYPDPNPGERSLRWMATHTLHELSHHLIDIRRQLDRADAALKEEHVCDRGSEQP